MEQERKELIIRLSRILRGYCYNGNIQNYARWGELESEGRWFTYPEKCVNSAGRRSRMPGNLHEKPEALLKSIHCAFGANQLFTYRALDAVLTYLEQHHVLQISDYEVQQRMAREEEARQRQLHQECIDHLARYLLEQSEGSVGAELVATADATKMDRTYAFDKEREALSKKQFAASVSRLLEVSCTDQPEVSDEDWAEAADRAVELRRQEETHRIMARYRSDSETEEDG